MARHRAPASPSRALATMALTGAALGVSLLSPAAAPAATGDDDASNQQATEPGTDSTGHEHSTTHRPSQHAHRHLRPMTSGERQYRTGCRQGYISEGCQLFTVPDLLHRGIDPFL